MSTNGETDPDYTRGYDRAARMERSKADFTPTTAPSSSGLRTAKAVPSTTIPPPSNGGDYQRNWTRWRRP